jgi:hypothetical protein
MWSAAAGKPINFLTKRQVGKKGEGSVWALATFDGGQRKAVIALGTFVATFDADGGAPLIEVEAACRVTGWFIVIIPSSCWGSPQSEISGDAYDAGAKGNAGADTGSKRYLVDVLQKTSSGLCSRACLPAQSRRWLHLHSLASDGVFRDVGAVEQRQ